jgi:hypothetical protein
MEQNSYTTGPGDKDPQLWEIARKRVGFKYHLASYIIVNSFLWIVWAFSGREYSGGYELPWPLWPMIGWGIGLAFHFLGAYVFPKSNSVDREYEKLRRSRK